MDYIQLQQITMELEIIRFKFFMAMREKQQLQIILDGEAVRLRKLEEEFEALQDESVYLNSYMKMLQNIKNLCYTNHC